MSGYLKTASDALRQFRTSGSAAEETWPLESHERVEGMTQSEFSKAGLIVHVDSEILGKPIISASDNVPDHRISAVATVAYRSSELRLLESIDVTPSLLRAVQAVKEAFGGSVIETRRGYAKEANEAKKAGTGDF